MSIKQLLSIFTLFLCLAEPTCVSAETTQIIRYPRLSALNDPQGEYILELLRQAIKNSGQSYQLIANEDPMQQARAIYEMTTGTGGIDIWWTMTTNERETQLIPIRIPIDKGLIGWRIPLVTMQNSDLLRNVKSIKDLNAFIAGQELDWPDVAILKNNGLLVNTSTSYEPLFNMLKAGRFDYFPRSVFEIQKEVDSHPKHSLAIDKNIILHYPAAVYFFVTPRERKMAEDLQNGLEEMIKNGSFEKIFQKHLQVTIKQANIKQRIVIELTNPLLSTEKLPLNKPELWYRP